jgi:hypothetical protein
LLKQAHERKENVHQLADYLQSSGLVSKTERESLIVDLFRRRKKLCLPKISSKG